MWDCFAECSLVRISRHIRAPTTLAFWSSREGRPFQSVTSPISKLGFYRRREVLSDRGEWSGEILRKRVGGAKDSESYASSCQEAVFSYNIPDRSGDLPIPLRWWRKIAIHNFIRWTLLLFKFPYSDHVSKFLTNSVTACAAGGSQIVG